MNVETVQSSLKALKNSGSVFGVIFAREDSVIYSDVPFAQERVEHVTTVLDDIGFYFKKENRQVDQLAFGYDGGNLVIVMDGTYRLIVLHSTPDEIDFIAKAAKSFLTDYQMGLFTIEFEKDEDQDRALQTVSPPPEPVSPEEVKIQAPMRPATTRITLKAEQGLDEDTPLQPKPQRAKLAPNQPASTLPPPKRPKARNG